jgi:hypothetical protein
MTMPTLENSIMMDIKDTRFEKVDSTDLGVQ